MLWIYHLISSSLGKVIIFADELLVTVLWGENYETV